MSCSSKTEGVVIRSYDYGDGHRIVVLFTRSLGKIKAAARGSRKTRSKFAATLEPLSENLFMLARKAGNGIYTLSGACPLEPHSPLRADMSLFGYGSLMLEGIDLLYEEDDPEEELYFLLREAMRDLEAGNPSSTAWLFMFRVLKMAGYRLNLFSCSFCGAKNPASARFSFPSGGILCEKCPDAPPSWTVPPGALAAVRKLSPARPLAEDSEQAIGNIVKKYIKYQLDKDLKSTEFLKVFKNRCISRN